MTVKLLLIVTSPVHGVGLNGCNMIFDVGDVIMLLITIKDPNVMVPILMFATFSVSISAVPRTVNNVLIVKVSNMVLMLVFVFNDPALLFCCDTKDVIVFGLFIVDAKFSKLVFAVVVIVDTLNNDLLGQQLLHPLDEPLTDLLILLHIDNNMSKSYCVMMN